MADLLVPFEIDQTDTAAAHNNAFDIVRTRYQANDQSVTNSTVFIASTSLVLFMEKSSTYAIETQLFFDATATANFKMKLAPPGGVPLWWADPGGSATFSLERAYSGLGAGVVRSVSPRGVIENTSVAGNLTIQFAQNTASTTATILKVGSWFQLTRVA